MKRGSFVGKRKAMSRMSAKVKASRGVFDAEYDKVDARSGGRCEVIVDGRRCVAKAVEHHHTRKPRRTWHGAEFIAHVCRIDHDRASASYRLGRLIFHKLRADWYGWDCELITKENKWAAS